MKKFNHEIVKQLYFNDISSIDFEILHKILSLPRTEIIEDLENVLVDAMTNIDFYLNHFEDSTEEQERKKYFENGYLSTDELEDLDYDFPVHSLYLLSELKATESFETIIDFISQDLNLIDFWLLDTFGSDGWRVLANTVSDRTLELLKFIINPNVALDCRVAANAALGQLALINPLQRAEVIHLYAKLLEYYSQFKFTDEDFEEIDLMDFIVGELISIHANELLLNIRDFYSKHEDYEWYTSLHDLELDLENNGYEYYPIPNIFEYYTKLRESEPTTESDDVELPIFIEEKVKSAKHTDVKKSAELIDKEEENKDKEIEKYIENYEIQNESNIPDIEEEEAEEEVELDEETVKAWEKQLETELYNSQYAEYIPVFDQPIVKEAKINRNDTCPCGSGKKYKKCCGKK